MIEKLQLYKFDNNSRKWILNYMKDRKVFVEIGTKKSSVCTVNRGVPQGSILGPLLFSIYSNELPEIANDEKCENPAHGKRLSLFNSNCKTCRMIPCYADDAMYHIGTKHRNLSKEILTEKVDKIKSFLNAQELVINVGKTNILESMVKQKRTKIRGFQPTLSTILETGE